MADGIGNVDSKSVTKLFRAKSGVTRFCNQYDDVLFTAVDAASAPHGTASINACSYGEWNVLTHIFRFNIRLLICELKLFYIHRMGPATIHCERWGLQAHNYE